MDLLGIDFDTPGIVIKSKFEKNHTATTCSHGCSNVNDIIGLPSLSTLYPCAFAFSMMESDMVIMELVKPTN